LGEAAVTGFGEEKGGTELPGKNGQWMWQTKDPGGSERKW